MLNALFHEFDNAWRSFMSSPGFFGLAIIAMALGLAATTFMYSTGSNYLISLPIENPENVMHLGFVNRTDPNNSRDALLPEYLEFKEQLTGVEELGALRSRTINVSDVDLPQRYDGADITASAFRVIDAKPFMGRVFADSDMQKGAEPVVIIGYNIWQKRYQSEPSIIGKQVRINGILSTVVGVMKEEFRYPRNEEIWIPMNIHISESTKRGGTIPVEVIGILKDGISSDNLHDEARTINSRMAEIYPDLYEEYHSLVQDYGIKFIGRQSYQVVYTLIGTSIMVLMIACANVANLFLALGAKRQREQAIQAALGASRARLILRALLESSIVCFLGGILGLVLGIYISQFVGRIVVSADPDIPFWIAQTMSNGFIFNSHNMQIVLYCFLAMVFATLLAGIVPAIRMSRPDINVVLKANETAAGSGLHNRFSRWLVIAEVAMACALLIGASLLLRSASNLNNIEIGVNTDRIMTSRVGLFESQFKTDAEKIQLYKKLKNELLKQPGIQNVGFSQSVPGNYASWYRFSKAGDSYPSDRDYPLTKMVLMSSDMDKIYGLSIVQGRMFDHRDTLNSQPVAMISQSMAKKLFPEGNVLGQQIQLGGKSSTNEMRTIIGILPYINYHGANEKDTMRNIVYIPMEQSPRQYFTVIIKTADNEDKYTATIAKAVNKVNPGQPVYWQRSLNDWIRKNQFYNHLQTNIMAAFAVLALVLASVGIYGVLSYSINQRTREFGIRRAMGADERNVMLTVFKQGLKQLLYGTSIGLVFAAALAKAIESQLVMVSTFDIFSFILIPVMLAIITITASWYPARRAAMIEPMEALRSD